MRPLSLLAWILIGASLASADSPATLPVPVDQIPVPPLRAVPIAAPPIAASRLIVFGVPSGAKVILLPFNAIGDTAHRDWVGKAVQESLASDVARTGDLSPVSASAAAGPMDTAAALAIAKSNGGDVVVFGSFQFAGTEVRLTGQVIDVRTGRALTGLKASGEFRDLFSLEDELATQTRARALRPPPPVTPADVAANDAAVFGQTAPNLTAADLYPASGTIAGLGDAYNRYYYNWDAYQPGYYPAYQSFGSGSFGGFGGFGGVFRFGGGFGHGFSHRGGHHR